jgi:hypothetical protein
VNVEVMSDGGYDTSVLKRRRWLLGKLRLRSHCGHKLEAKVAGKRLSAHVRDNSLP